MTTERVQRPWLALRTGAATVDSEGPGSNVWVAVLDGHRCRTSPRFLDAIGRALAFPPYYGHNWDAFDECFRDLFDITEGGMGSEWGGSDGRPEHTLHLVVDHADELLVDDDPRYLSIVLDDFRAPCHDYDPPQPWRRWAGFRATFVCTPDAIDAFTDRLEVAGLQQGDLT